MHVGSRIASGLHPGDEQFESWQEHRLPRLRVFVVLLSPLAPLIRQRLFHSTSFPFHYSLSSNH
jgi:hypothetical protein